MKFKEGALEKMSDEEKEELFKNLKEAGVAPFCYDDDDDENCCTNLTSKKSDKSSLTLEIPPYL
jgi:hypothetical protein